MFSGLPARDGLAGLEGSAIMGARYSLGTVVIRGWLVLSAIWIVF